MKETPSVAEYIAACPKSVQGKLRKMRAAIKDAAPRSKERTDYFAMPGYSYAGYDYDGMFVWFSYRKDMIRLHVRPPVLQNHKKEISPYATTKAILSFPADKEIPTILVKKLVKASVAVMKKATK